MPTYHHNGRSYIFCGTRETGPSAEGCIDSDCNREWSNYQRAYYGTAPEAPRLEVITEEEAALPPGSLTIERERCTARVAYFRGTGSTDYIVPSLRYDLPPIFALIQRDNGGWGNDPLSEWYIYANGEWSDGKFLRFFPELKAAVLAALENQPAPVAAPVDPNTYYCAEHGRRHAISEPKCETCGNCAFACESRGLCYSCASCDTRHYRRTRTRCNACNNCTERHNCTRCRTCDSYYSMAPGAARSGCADCNRCDSCACRCRGRSCKIKFVENPIDLDRFRSTSFVLNRSRRMASCELEVAKGGDRTVDEVISKWGMTVKTDGSVDDGVEINTAPANGDNLVNQLTELASILNTTKVEADKRCGYHLHVDARDFAWGDMRKAMLAWAHVEAEAYNLVPQSRRANKYCAPRAEQIRGILDFDASLSSADVKQKVMLVVADGIARPSPSISIPFGQSEPPPAPARCVEYSPSQNPEFIGSGTGGHRYCDNMHHNWRRRVLVNGERSNQGLHYWREDYASDIEPLLNECTNQYFNRVRTIEIAKWRKDPKRLFHADLMRRTYPKRKGDGSNQVGGDRYYAFNVQSWFKYGTVEIRLHHGTVNRDKIVNWALLWTSFFDWCKVATLADIERFCKLDPWGALLSVAPTDAVRRWMSARRKKLAGISDDADATTPAVESDNSLALSLGSALPIRRWRSNAITLRDWRPDPIVTTEQPRPERPVSSVRPTRGVFYASAPRAPTPVTAAPVDHPYTDTGIEGDFPF
jgi:hypothetical protein